MADRSCSATPSFGPPLTARGVTGNVVLAQSTTGTDGCSPILNDVSGAIALIDRGVCAFTVKVKNAQDAGAIAVLIADNVFAAPSDVVSAGTTPRSRFPRVVSASPTGPPSRPTSAAGVRVRMALDLSVVAGTDRVKGQVMLAAFNPVIPGSSISHFEPVARPNQIMEPAINADLVSSVKPPEDLTTPLLTDLGWFTDRDGVQDGVDFCLGSDISPTVVIRSCDSGVPNEVRQARLQHRRHRQRVRSAAGTWRLSGVRGRWRRLPFATPEISLASSSSRSTAAPPALDGGATRGGGWLTRSVPYPDRHSPAIFCSIRAGGGQPAALAALIEALRL